MTNAHALRRAIASTEETLRNLRAVLAALDERDAREGDGANVEAPAPQVRGQAFLSLKEAAFRLGLSYDAARVKAKRAGVAVADGRDALVPSDWVDSIVRKNPGNVRTCSVAEHATSE